MGFFKQLLHRFSTGSGQPEDRINADLLQRELQALSEAFAVLERDYREDAKKTSKKLESYRARRQPRKDGRFAPEVAPESPIDGGDMVGSTHEEIERIARSRGLIR